MIVINRKLDFEMEEIHWREVNKLETYFQTKIEMKKEKGKTCDEFPSRDVEDC